MMQIIFAFAIAIFSTQTTTTNEIVETQHDFVYVELHDTTRFDVNEFDKTFDACYANNDTQTQIDECVRYAINSYSRVNA